MPDISADHEVKAKAPAANLAVARNDTAVVLGAKTFDIQLKPKVVTLAPPR